MILHDAYAALKRLGLVANHAAFSTDYLNKAPRHYDDLICSGRAPSVAALLSLFVRVRAIADAFAGSPSVAMHATELDGIAVRIWSELERRCCCLLPQRVHRTSMVRAAARPRGAPVSGQGNAAHRSGADLAAAAHAVRPDVSAWRGKYPREAGW